MSDESQPNVGLATIEEVVSVIHHPNADKLDIIKVLGYDAIVGRDQFKAGDKIIFVQPDSILPSDQAWASPLLRYTSRGRLRAVRLRGEWSMGLVCELGTGNTAHGEVGEDLTQDLGITKYEPPLPADASARGGLPFLIPKTDENRWQNLRNLDALMGSKVDVFQKVDGSSFTAYCVLPEHNPNLNQGTEVGLCSRSLDLKVGEDENGQKFGSKWHQAELKYNVLDKLTEYCTKNGVSLALRGEIYGNGIQNFGHNPHADSALDVAFFSVYNIGAKKYERKGSDHYFLGVCTELLLPTVPAIERDVELTEELIKHYDNETKTLFHKPYEGVVVQHDDGSFKVINKWYDADKE